MAHEHGRSSHMPLRPDQRGRMRSPDEASASCTCVMINRALSVTAVVARSQLLGYGTIQLNEKSKANIFRIAMEPLEWHKCARCPLRSPTPWTNFICAFCEREIENETIVSHSSSSTYWQREPSGDSRVVHSEKRRRN